MRDNISQPIFLSFTEQLLNQVEIGIDLKFYIVC